MAQSVNIRLLPFQTSPCSLSLFVGQRFPGQTMCLFLLLSLRLFLWSSGQMPPRYIRKKKKRLFRGRRGIKQRRPLSFRPIDLFHINFEGGERGRIRACLGNMTVFRRGPLGWAMQQRPKSDPNTLRRQNVPFIFREPKRGYFSIFMLSWQGSTFSSVPTRLFWGRGR